MNAKIALKVAIRKVGGMGALSRKLGITYQSIQQWVEKNEVPAGWLVAVEAATGVPRELLRPDLFKGVKVTREKELEPA